MVLGKKEKTSEIALSFLDNFNVKNVQKKSCFF
jgi:hypothetical protein